MRRRVVWSPTSREDLIAIARYIADENPAAARVVSAKLRTAGETLGDASTGRPGRVPGTFEKSVQGLPYILAYEVVPDAGGEAVAILHVIHTARDWPPGAWPQD